MQDRLYSFSVSLRGYDRYQLPTTLRFLRVFSFVSCFHLPWRWGYVLVALKIILIMIKGATRMVTWILLTGVLGD